VALHGQVTTAWYQTDPQTGATVDVLPDGGHGVVDLASFFNGVLLVAVFVGAEAVAGATYGALAATLVDFVAVVSGVWPARLTKGLLQLVANKLLSLPGRAAFFLVLLSLTHLAGVDPPVLPGLWGNSIPIPTPGNLSSNAVALTASAPTGNTTGTAAVPNVAASGQLSAAWSTSSTSAFRLSSLGAASATVRDANGNPVGTGAIGLSAAAPVPASIAGTNQYSVNGTGSLSFYGPAESSLGVGGNWTAYSATVTGNVALTLTTDGLTLNGQALPAGTYTISTSSATLGGSGPSASPNFSGSASLTATGGTINLGAGSGNVIVGGGPLDLTSGATLTGYTGTLAVAAGGGGGTDTVTLNGSAANVLRVSASPAALTADQNTPATFRANVQTSFADTYNLTAKAPPGWAVSIDNSQNVTVTPAPGLQGGTCAVQLIAQSKTNPDLVAQTAVNVTVTPTQPGTTLSVVPDPLLTVPFTGSQSTTAQTSPLNAAQLPTAFQAVIHNNGPAPVTENLTFPSVPSGFTILSSGTSVTIPAGQTGIVGVYLQPTGTQTPAVGTPASFTVTATNASNPADVHTANEPFTIPAVAGVTLASNPVQVNAAPGVPGAATLTAANVGNVPENLAVDASASPGLTVTGLGPVSPAVGQSTTEALTLTPAAGTPLNSSLAATILAAPPLPQDAVAVLQVAPNPAAVEPGQHPDVSATCSPASASRGRRWPPIRSRTPAGPSSSPRRRCRSTSRRWPRLARWTSAR
jgi:hypothetical protein